MNDAEFIRHLAKNFPGLRDPDALDARICRLHSISYKLESKWYLGLPEDCGTTTGIVVDPLLVVNSTSIRSLS